MSSKQSDSCILFSELSQTDTISLSKLTKQKQRHGKKPQKKEQMNRFKNWSEGDTKKFLRSLELFGTDFYMINFLFNDRTRTQLKRKYKKEKNSPQLQEALRNSRVNSMDIHDKLLLFQQEFIECAAAISESFIEFTCKHAGPKFERRRCAFDSDSLEEYIQLATLGQNQTNLFYDDKKLKWIKGLKQIDDQEDIPKDIEGFEHNHSSPQVDYIDTSELPPDIILKSNDEIFSHHIMILGDINEYLKQSLTLFCMQSRKNSSEEFNEELISPIKSKLCLDLAIKRIQEKNGVHVVKFLMHDMTVSNYAPIINVYFLQTSNYIIVIDIDSLEYSDKSEETLVHQIQQRATKVKQIYVIYFTESDLQVQRVPNKYYSNRWNISVILSQIIEQVINNQ